jgi:hypothetical protein
MQQRQSEIRVARRVRQTLRLPPEFNDQAKAGRIGCIEPEDTKATDFEQSRERRRRACHSVRYIHLIVGHERKSVRQQAHHQVGFPRPGWSRNQNCLAAPGRAASVHSSPALHRVEI